MTVNTFDPSTLNAPVDESALAQLCAMGAAFTADVLTLSEQQVERFAPLATIVDWAERAEALSDAEITGLIRIFTLGEMAYSNWAAGEKSPVVPLVKALKSRGSYDSALTSWIKAHTTNKFLPHGSLLDRL